MFNLDMSPSAGSKAVPRPGGIGSAAQPSQQPTDSDNVFSKILPGGAAEQAGKLGDGKWTMMEDK